MLKLLLTLSMSTLLLISCASHAKREYVAVRKNIRIMKDLPAINVQNFSQASHLKNSVQCRMLGPVIVTKNGQNYAGYIEEAMLDELDLAGKYNSNAKNKLNITITEVDNSSLKGYWKIRGEVFVNHHHFSVTTIHNFSTAISANSACEAVADSFADAVAMFIRDVITHQEFRRSLR